MRDSVTRPVATMMYAPSAGAVARQRPRPKGPKNTQPFVGAVVGAVEAATRSCDKTHHPRVAGRAFQHSYNGVDETGPRGASSSIEATNRTSVAPSAGLSTAASNANPAAMLAGRCAGMAEYSITGNPE